MQRKSIIILGFIILFICGSSMVTADENEETMCIPMGTIMLDPPESVEAKRSSVEFPHSVHFSYSCKTCHHKWVGDTDIVSCQTSGCHDMVKTPEKKDQTKADKASANKYYKEAFHTQCIGCHKKIKENNKKMELSGRTLKDPLPMTGPTSCGKCHEKE